MFHCYLRRWKIGCILETQMIFMTPFKKKKKNSMELFKPQSDLCKKEFKYFTIYVINSSILKLNFFEWNYKVPNPQYSLFLRYTSKSFNQTPSKFHIVNIFIQPTLYLQVIFPFELLARIKKNGTKTKSTCKHSNDPIPELQRWRRVFARLHR